MNPHTSPCPAETQELWEEFVRDTLLDWIACRSHRLVLVFAATIEAALLMGGVA